MLEGRSFDYGPIQERRTITAPSNYLLLSFKIISRMHNTAKNSCSCDFNYLIYWSRYLATFMLLLLQLLPLVLPLPSPSTCRIP
jgi:hypothetical protein